MRKVSIFTLLLALIFAGSSLSAQETVELTIATVNNPDMVVMESFTEEFEAAYPNISLNWVILPENELRSTVTTDVATGSSTFDIVTVGIFEVPIWAQNGWIHSIDALAAENPDNVQPDYDFDDLLEGVRLGLSVDDELYAVPFYGESSMLYYNTTLFEEAGLEMPEQPTWEEIREFACTLHDPDNGQYGIALRGLPGWGEMMAPLTTVVNTYGGRWFDENWEPQLTSPEWNEAVSFYVNLINDCGQPGATGTGFTEALTLMAQGQAAMWVDATVAAGFLSNPEQSQIVDELGFAPAPVGPVEKGNHWLWSWNLAIPMTTQHPAEALQFITWATSRDYIQLVGETNGWATIPPGTRVSTYENENYLDAAPFAPVVLDLMQTADPTDSTRDPVPYVGVQFVGIPEFQGIGTDVSQYIAEALSGDATVEEALQRANDATREAMEEAGYFD
ncbi:sugar ABC transporter substrate-binding protein [Phototrophicus methaneseepsis]|uniref:Sugar ABC transporter substrate-binding protein n=1 Tax=Phototrophicus methaneseepsis TaxID=2710758 RepID=A0A7S8EAF0_9CHLR|nr:sugar ABC transporter substrate-binding protein [Phototrophicus methaneseepsis]QPC83358.1 sugar ABC transporter substrate-binding protein [Phototrophicus methaneseepsis]